jgi:hypothetical protein
MVVFKGQVYVLVSDLIFFCHAVGVFVYEEYH